MDWVSSGGGPLICLDRSIIHAWKGVDGLGDLRYRDQGFRTDYERACAIKDYLGAISVLGSTGLVLGDMPLETTVLSIDGAPLIARVLYSQISVDVRSMLSDGIYLERATEVERTSISVNEEKWNIFDSAYPGTEIPGKCLTMFLPLGKVLIRTYEYMPDQSTSLLIHQFSYSRS